MPRADALRVLQLGRCTAAVLAGRMQARQASAARRHARRAQRAAGQGAAVRTRDDGSASPDGSCARRVALSAPDTSGGLKLVSPSCSQREPEAARCLGRGSRCCALGTPQGRWAQHRCCPGSRASHLPVHPNVVFQQHGGCLPHCFGDVMGQRDLRGRVAASGTPTQHCCAARIGTHAAAGTARAAAR